VRFRLVIRPRADTDIDQIAEHIAIDNLRAGKSFYDAVIDAFERLGFMPHIGAPRPTSNRSLPRASGVGSSPATRTT